MFKLLKILVICLLGFSLVGCVHGSSLMSYKPASISETETKVWPTDCPGFTVLTYNIRDLPKVVDKERGRGGIDKGRSKVAIDIGHRIAEMRERCNQPKIIILQEAFRKGAENLNRYGKYPYLVYGPDKAPKTDIYPISEEFHNKRSFRKGEKSGTILNSGLAILSDYPILRTKTVGFPSGMCAGYDCLASKGVLIAWIKIPEFDKPVAFVAIHMNSREPTGVSGERADEAYHHQIKMLQHTIETEIDEDTLIVMAGDLNMGHAPQRLATLREVMGDYYENALRDAERLGVVEESSAKHFAGILDYHVDVLLLRNTPDQRLVPEHAWVPFPKGMKESFSDHTGFILSFSAIEKQSNDEVRYAP